MEFHIKNRVGPNFCSHTPPSVNMFLGYLLQQHEGANFRSHDSLSVNMFLCVCSYRQRERNFAPSVGAKLCEIDLLTYFPFFFRSHTSLFVIF